MTRSQGNALNTRQYTAGHGTQVTQHLNDEAGQLKHDVYRLTEKPMTCAEKSGYKQVIPVIHPNERGVYKQDEKQARVSLDPTLYKELPSTRPSSTRKPA